MPRRLLNTASIVCLVLCVALMGMWVRSYSATAEGWPNMPGIVIQSVHGVVVLYEHSADRTGLPNDRSSALKAKAKLLYIAAQMSCRGRFSSALGFAHYFSSGGSLIRLPYWFLVLTTGTLARAFQIRWSPRFTLRSLFVATTFLAVVLGMIAWLDRDWVGK